MTLFIAVLIIYQFGMNPWLYLVAVAISVANLVFAVRVKLMDRDQIDEAIRHAREAAHAAENAFNRL